MNEHATVEIRSAPLASVDYPARVVELFAVPYDEWTWVEYAGRMIEESFAPGSFGAVERRVGRARFQVNLDHDPSRWVGRVLALRSRDPKGLRAELMIRRTPEGDQVLLDAADGMYGASVGFAVGPEDQTWESRDRRRITKAFLDHIALTPTPAYQGADVIAVRAAPSSSTPNLDRILAMRDAEAYGPR